MTLIIVLISIAAYLGIGIPVGLYSRKRSYNKAFHSWYRRNYGSEEYRIKEAMRDVKRYDSVDVATAGILGFVAWPVFAIGFFGHWLFLKLQNKFESSALKTDADKMLEALQAKKQLEEDYAKAIKVLEAAGLKKEHITIE